MGAAMDERIRAIAPFVLVRGKRKVTLRPGELVEGLTREEFSRLLREGKIAVSFHRPARVVPEH